MIIIKLTQKQKGLILSILIVLFTNIFIFRAYLPQIFIINTSYSLPVGIYLISNDKNYTKGDIVVIDPPTEIKNFMVNRGYLKNNNYLLKKIYGMQGDIYTTKDNLSYINDKYIGTIYKVDSSNRPLPQFTGKHIIPAGYFLPIADNRPNSYDGRYFGLLNTNVIKFKVYPLITFK